MKLKMSDAKKSALLALICIPITFLLLEHPSYLSSITDDEIRTALLVPTIIVFMLWESAWGFSGIPDWLPLTAGLIAPYPGYFLIIYVLIKSIRVLKNIRAKNSVKEQSEKDPSGP